MTRDEAKIANALWDRNKEVINAIARHGFESADFVYARLWLRARAIEREASTNRVRLTFLDQSPFDFADRDHIALEIGVELKNGDTFEMCGLPVKLELDISTRSGIRIEVDLMVPGRDSDYRTRFEQALHSCKPPIKPDGDEWCTSVELGKVEIDKTSAHFDIDALVDQLPGMLRDITERVLEPLALALKANTNPN